LDGSASKPRATSSGLFYGWIIVVAAGIVTALGSGCYYYGLGVFFVPLTNEFGWSRTLTSSAYSLDRVLVCLFSVAAGFAFDRFGPRRLMSFGVGLMACGFALLSQVQVFPAFLLAVSFLSAGFSFGFTMIAMATVANWFIRRRTTALGLLMAGGGAGGILVPLISGVIESLGWRTAALGVAALLLVIGLPLAQIVRHRPEEMGLRPDGDPPDPGARPTEMRTTLAPRAPVRPAAPDSDYTVGRAIRTRTFWMLVASGSLFGVAQAGLNVHIIPHLLGVGIPAAVAASAVAAMTILSVAGRLGFGWLGDRLPKRYALALSYGLTFLGLVVFANIAATWQLGLFLALYAPGYGGTIPLRPSLQGEYFGRRYFGAIQGVIVGGGAVGSLIGPIFAGRMYDLLGDYRTAFWIMALIAAAAVPACLAIPRAKSQDSLPALRSAAR
jgi:MFS family permease